MNVDELSRAVTALVVDGAVLGPCSLVRAGNRIICSTSRKVLARANHRPLFCATSFAARDLLPLTAPLAMKYEGTAEFAIGAPWPVGDVTPADAAALGPGAERAASIMLVGIERDGGGFRRVCVEARTSVSNWVSRGGAGDDCAAVFAEVDAPPPASWMLDGGCTISRYPASRVLGRPAEAYIDFVTCTEAVGLPPGRAHKAFAELVPLHVR